MARLQLTPILVFISLLLSSVLSFANEDTDDPLLNVNGYVSVSTHTFNSNEMRLPNVELGIGAVKEINDNNHIYGSLSYNNKDYVDGTQLKVNSLYLSSSYSLNDYEIKTQIGRIKNSFFLHNESRNTPMSRPSVVLPQAIYWNVLDQIATTTDGVSFSVKNNIGLEGFTSVSKYKLHDSTIINEALNFPGTLGDGNAKRVGVKYVNKYINVGGQRIVWDIDSNMFKQLQLKSNNFYIKISNGNLGGSYEKVISRTSIDVNNTKPAIGESYTIYYNINENLRVSLNRNTFNYNLSDGVIKMFNIPDWKKSVADNNISLSYKPPELKNVMVKLEHHIVKGGSWLLIRDNPNGIVKDWNFTSLQISHSF